MPVKFHLDNYVSCFLSQLGYLLSNFYQLRVLVRTLRTRNIMTMGGMNGKWASKNFFWKWISCREGENDEMGIPNSRERSRLNEKVGMHDSLLLLARNTTKIISFTLMVSLLDITKQLYFSWFFCWVLFHFGVMKISSNEQR